MTSNLLGFGSLLEKLDGIMAPPKGTTQEEVDSFRKWQDDDNKAKYYMLASMSDELQRQHEKMTSGHAILLHLQELDGVQNQSIRYEISRDLFRCRITEGLAVDKHVLNMVGLKERLESLNSFMEADLQEDMILQSLFSSFFQFIMNYYMTKQQHTLAKLLKMLILPYMQMKGKDKEAALIASTSKDKKFKAQDEQ
ncbi:hypothetical protein ACH5RR_039405 [Cinchona calisaya]|uniref:Uncharacterized protein n=1 Tax=Cinchona calisaya TaxID=153742 RepID=A0ABD2Y391_9GENT